jgi:predicted transcriptional regulator
MKDSSITIRIDSDTKLRLEQIAKDDERSVSSLITLILKRYLAEHPAKD